ncbi:Inhibitor of nuclear factor kappa-B kinase-interacting protein [Oryzias melastigma]|uniref:Inhibitor of nuclear factor kappa-B kinase-interacting protein n=1 Tax=Oryzias melastigma TaxID=30732 RepID=A0A834FE29_ORYME|nr:Inhibitor of nuclear factor kappa-B kinase-interacting protein [Oryzias melastigma]
MSTDVKQRKKAKKQGASELTEASSTTCKHEAVKTEEVLNSRPKKSSSAARDIKSFICAFLFAVCGALSWAVLQQNERFSQMEEKFKFLHEKTSSLLTMEEEIIKVSEKCVSVEGMLAGLEGQQGALRPQLLGLEQDVRRLKEWASGLSEKRTQLQSSMTSLRGAVEQIEARTSAITKDFVNKVSSVRTDVRRMDGLQSELESLLTKVGDLESKSTQVEHSMVKRIGDVLASSIDRISSLRSASERNSQAIEKLRKRVPELTAADAQLSERLRELESGRARLIRTVTFAGDLKPKVATIKRDFGAFEPQLVDLTLRIGRLAEDLLKREQEHHRASADFVKPDSSGRRSQPHSKAGQSNIRYVRYWRYTQENVKLLMLCVFVCSD